MFKLNHKIKRRRAESKTNKKMCLFYYHLCYKSTIKHNSHKTTTNKTR